MPSKRKEIPQAPEDFNRFLELKNVVDSVEDELLVIDGEYRVRLGNSAALSKFKRTGKSPIGQLCYQVFQKRDEPCSSPLWECPLQKVLQSGQTSLVIHPIRTAGVETYFKVTAYPIRDKAGKIKGIVELRRDVTAERKLETQILKRHHQLLVLNRISNAISGLLDLDTILKITLDNVLEIIGGTIGGILLLDAATNKLYYRVQHGLPTEYVQEVRISLGEGISGRVVQNGEAILLEDISKDPRTVNPDLISAEGLKGFVSIPLKVKDNVIGAMNIASHAAGRFGMDDLSLLNSIGNYLGVAIEQARLYTRLKQAGERYQSLLQHALMAQEQERKRIARELHDETSQAITSLTLNLQACIGMMEMKGITDTDLMGKLKTTHSDAVNVGREIVQLMKELRPILLDELGLPAAIHRYAKDNLQTQGINVAVEFDGTDQRFPPEVEITLYRIAQGLIGNVMEHSEAKNVTIKVNCDASACELLIGDDGKGFDVSKLTQVEPSGRGAGLFTMKERARLVGGYGSIESKPGHGTKVTVHIPLAQDIEDEKDKSADR